MSDDPSGWAPVHHFEPDEDGEADGKSSTDTAAGAKKPAKQGAKGDTPVGLVLSLPEDFVSAAWGIGDQVLRLATAVEANTKTVLKLLEKMDQTPE